MPTFSLSGATDLPYCDVDGDDIPDMYYGRFSASDSAQLQPQIDKTLEYEKYEMANPSYLGEAVMIAGVDGTWSLTHANGQIYYATTHYVNPAHGIESHTYFYPESASQGTAVIADVSAGCGLVNYTAHGSIYSWNDPAFGRNDVAALENAHEYPLVIANACLTSAFQNPLCFGESWLRAENRGSIGYIGASNSTYWDEDYDWAVGNDGLTGVGSVSPNPTYEQTGLGAFDGMFHDHGEEFGQWYIAAASHIFCGNLAVMESASLLKTYYWEIYNLLGDPSLTAYLGVPTSNPVVLPGSIDPLDTQVIVSAAPKSYVGITQNGLLLGSALVGPTGTVAVFITPPANKGSVHVVVTAQNRIPYTADVPVAATQAHCLLVSPDSLDFGGVVQGVHPSQSTALWNLCPGAQNWVITDRPDWLSAAPESGSLTPAPAMRTVFVTGDVDSLPVGASRAGQVRFESEGGACSLYVSVEARNAALLSAPVVRSPKDSAEVASLTPALIVANAAAKGTPDLWVHFEIDTSLAFSSPRVQRSGLVAEGDSTAEWTPAQLLENRLWFWRAWRASAYAVGDTCDPAAFYVNAANECPDSAAPVVPAAESTLVVLRPSFSWGAAADRDPRDSVVYRLFVESGGAWDSLYAGMDTTAEWPDSLADNATYLWKVAADDEHGCRTWSVT
ncbi:MAG: C25 family cysteine peptidase, partial [Planctomycetota bacterium]